VPSVYLSPSTNEQNRFATGKSEEYYMNLVVDAMIPYLRASGIEFDRNNPNDTPQQIVDKSNSKYHDIHLILNTEPGAGQGVKVTYYTASPGGSKAAGIFATNLKEIYPSPELVTVDYNRLNKEMRDTNAVALLVSLGYRENIEDAKWIEDHIDEIARNLSMSLAEYLNVPFVEKASSERNWR